MSRKVTLYYGWFREVQGKSLWYQRGICYVYPRVVVQLESCKTVRPQDESEILFKKVGVRMGEVEVMFGYWVDAGDGRGRVVGGGGVVGFRVIDFCAPSAWWLVSVLVTKPFTILKLGRTFVLPMALLAAIHTAAFGLVAFSFFVGEFLELLSVLWRKVGEGDAGGVVRFRSEGVNVGATALGLSGGVIGAPALVEFFGECHEA